MTKSNQDRHADVRVHMHTRTSSSHVEDAKDLIKKENVRHLANSVIGGTDPIATSNNVRQNM